MRELPVMVGSHNYWTLNNLGPTKGEDFSRQYQIAKYRLLLLFYPYFCVTGASERGQCDAFEIN